MNLKLNLTVLVSSLFFYGQSLYVSAAPDVKVEVYANYENSKKWEHVKITARDQVSIKNIELNRGGCEIINFKWNPTLQRSETPVPADLKFGDVLDLTTKCDTILEVSIDFGDQKEVYKIE